MGWHLHILKIFTDIHVQKIITMKNGRPDDLSVQIRLNGSVDHDDSSNMVEWKRRVGTWGVRLRLYYCSPQNSMSRLRLILCKYLLGTDYTLGSSTSAPPACLPSILDWKEFFKVMSATRRAISVNNSRECDLSSHYLTRVPGRHHRGG